MPASTAARVAARSSGTTGCSDDRRAGALAQQREREPVGLVHAARLGRRAELEQLGPGGQDVDDRAAPDRDLPDARGREPGEPLHGQRRAGGGEHVAAPDVLAAVADVEPAGERRGRRHVAVLDGGVLDAQDRVRAVGQRGAGGDAERGAGRERLGGDVARGHLAAHASSGAGGSVSAARTA